MEPQKTTEPQITFSLSALRNTKLSNDLAAIVRQHSVLISPVANLLNGGSGTLVRYKNFFGILTATHVMAGHIKATGIYSPILRTPDPTYFFNEFIPIKKMIYLETPEGVIALTKKDWPEGALDICLIQLEKNVFDRVLDASGKKAVDLDCYKERYLNNFEKYGTDSNQNWSWANEGSPRQDGIHNDKGVLESKFDGLYLSGGSKEGSTFRTHALTLVSPPFDKDADCICHDFGPSEDALPSRFGGMSGSGTWQVSFRGKNGIPEEIDEMFFAGVCVSETIPQQTLYSRGPSSLYDIFIRYLDTLS